MKYCHNCGFELGDREPFCSNCGVEQVVDDAQAQRILCGVCGQSCFAAEAKTTPAGVKVCSLCSVQTAKFKKIEADTGQRGDRAGILASLHPRMAERVTFDLAYARIRKRDESFFAALLGDREGKTGPVLDLSTTGLQCATELDVNEDDEVVIELKVPGLREPLELNGRIKWVKASSPPRRRIGVQFEKNEGETRQALERLVQKTSFDLARRHETRQDDESRPGPAPRAVRKPDLDF